MPAATITYAFITRNGKPGHNQLFISYHAYKRAKERLNWNRRTMDRMVVIVYTEGRKRSHLCSQLRKYTSELLSDYPQHSNLRIYGETIFIFRKQTLVTLFHVPTEYKKYLKYSVQKNTNYEIIVIN